MASTDALDLGMTQRLPPPPRSLSPKGQAYLFKRLRLAISMGAGPCASGSFFLGPTAQQGWEVPEPVLPVSQGRKCEKTDPRSAP